MKSSIGPGAHLTRKPAREGLLMAGGVDRSRLIWRAFDGVGQESRNGLNFTERGFGIRSALGCSDRGHSAASQIRMGEIDGETIFGTERARWFHTGGIFAALSETTPAVALEAMQAARHNGAIVSYDLNYRPSLWQAIGGKARAQKVNRELVGEADVLLGNEEDFTAALGFGVEGVDGSLSSLETASYARMVERVVAAYPNLRAVATTLRTVRSASRNDWGAILWASGQNVSGPHVAGSRDPRSGRRRRFICLRPGIRIPFGPLPGGGDRVGRCARCARDNDAGRRQHGQPGRSGEAGPRRFSSSDSVIGRVKDEGWARSWRSLGAARAWAPTAAGIRYSIGPKQE